MGVDVAEFFGVLGLKVDKAAWDRGNKQIDGMRTAVLGIGAYFGGRELGSALISYNANLEDARNQIAGMLALSKKTDLADQFGSADKLVENLRQRAAKLPGTTAEYVSMLGMLTQPLISAGLGLQDLEDLTVNATVGAKALNIAWDVAARDIDQAVRGQFHSIDQFTGKILGSIGFVGEEGRKRFNAMDQQHRAMTLKAALSQKQLTQLAEAQGKSFRGVWSTLVDAVEQFLGKVGLPLFKALGEAIQSANAYLEEHADDIAAVADVIGSVLAAAFAALSEVISFLLSGSDEATAVLIGLGVAIMTAVVPALFSMAAGWIAALWPLILIAAAVTGIVLLVKKVGPKIVAAFRVAWDWVADKARWVADKIRSGFETVRDFVVGVATAIKDAFVAAFEWIAGKIQWLIDKYEWIKAKLDEQAKQSLDKLGVAKEDQTTSAKTAATILQGAIPGFDWILGDGEEPSAPSVAGGGATVNNNQSQTNTFNITSTDPKVAADEAKKALDDHWSTIANNRGIPR